MREFIEFIEVSEFEDWDSFWTVTVHETVPSRPPEQILRDAEYGYVDVARARASTLANVYRALAVTSERGAALEALANAIEHAIRRFDAREKRA